MRSSTLAPLPLVIGIAIGFGAATLLGEGAVSPGGAASSPARQGDGARGGLDAGTPTLSAPGPLQRTLGDTDPDSVASADARAALERTAASARSAVAAAAEGEQTGTLRGVVRDTGGDPVAGAVVVARPARLARDAYEFSRATSGVGRAWDGFEPIETWYEAPMTRVLEERRGAGTATTDEDGRFLVEGLRVGRFSMTAYAEGFQGDPVEARTGAEVELRVTPVTSFEIEPRMPGGSVPGRAVIELESGGRRGQFAWSEDAPWLRIPERVATLRVLAGDVPAAGRRGFVGTYTSDQRTIDLDVDGAGPHVFELAATPVVRVTLFGANGDDPMETAWVRLDSEGQDSLELTRVDETTFVAGEVAPGAYRIVAGEIEGVEALTEPLDVTEGLHEPSLQLPAADPDDVLVIRCVDGAGRAVEEVSFTIELHLPAGRAETRRIDPTEHGRGEWWLPRSAVRSRDSRPSPFDLIATSNALGTARVPVTVDLPSVQLVFDPPCRLVVEVQGSRSRGLHLSLRESDAERGAPFSLSASVARSLLMRPVPSSGRLVVGAVQPGRYDISLNTAKSPWATMPIVARSVVLESGPHVETLALPPLHDLTVRLPEEAIGESVRLAPEGAAPMGSVMARAVDNTGLATFHKIPAGDYRLNAGSNRWPGGVMRVTVPCGVVEFAAQQVLGLEVLRIADDAPLAGSGLRAGDVILGSGDRDGGDPSFLNDISTALASGPVTVEVQRGSVVRSVVLQVDAADVPHGGFPVSGVVLRRSLR